MTAKQFREWETYAELEPFDEIRADYRASSIVTMLANKDLPKGHRPYKIEDFLLQFEPKEKQTPQQHANILMMITNAYISESNLDQLPDVGRAS